MSSHPPIRFGVIGINHGHIYGQTNLLLKAGAELASFFAKESDLSAQFSDVYPQARQVQSAEEILEDESIHLIASAAIPDERAPLGIQAMQHGKDFMSDKPAFVSLEQLEEVRQIQAETGRIYSIDYSERLEVPAAVKAGELVQAGAIGDVVQTIGIGPHRARMDTRPDWFFTTERYGGIIIDIGAHQADQCLFYTGSTEAEVVSAQVGNFKYPQYPEFEDFGDLTLRGNGGTGYIRIDWYTPDGLDTWGDGRLFILGTEGYIELRKYADIMGRPGGNHLFLVDQQGMHYIDCQDVELPYGQQLIHDIVHRTETAMPQAHCFLASELAIKAQTMAVRLGYLGGYLAHPGMISPSSRPPVVVV
jgi:predicted dehydrogenase